MGTRQKLPDARSVGAEMRTALTARLRPYQAPAEVTAQRWIALNSLDPAAYFTAAD